MMKKFLAIFLILTSLFLFSCSDGPAPDNYAESQKEQEITSTPPEEMAEAQVTSPEQGTAEPEVAFSQPEEEIEPLIAFRPIEEEEVPAEPVEPEKTYLKYQSADNFFELPLNGATGFAPTSLNLRAEASTKARLLASLKHGQPFLILEEVGDWWKVDVEGTIGYVFHAFCMINLPDVLPSAVYQNTNASSSVLRASFTDIPNITGIELYSAYEYNERLGKNEYIMPVLYSAAQKIAHAQQLALNEGNTLIINELYRPREVQKKIVAELTKLSRQDREILAGISAPPWAMNWFIATSLSNHQRGFAMDASLGKVLATGLATSGEYEYPIVSSFVEYEMQTPIHELSFRSASQAYPVSSKNDTDWRAAPVSADFTEGSVLLRAYCTNAGLSPLASEWWHFNDLPSRKHARSVGDFYIDTALSKPPMDFDIQY